MVGSGLRLLDLVERGNNIQGDVPHMVGVIKKLLDNTH